MLNNYKFYNSVFLRLDEWTSKLLYLKRILQKTFKLTTLLEVITLTPLSHSPHLTLLVKMYVEEIVMCCIFKYVYMHSFANLMTYWVTSNLFVRWNISIIKWYIYPENFSFGHADTKFVLGLLFSLCCVSVGLSSDTIFFN